METPHPFGALSPEEIEQLVDEARAIVAGESTVTPTPLHLWAALRLADGSASDHPPPTVFGQLPLPFERLH